MKIIFGRVDSKYSDESGKEAIVTGVEHSEVAGEWLEKR